MGESSPPSEKGEPTSLSLFQVQCRSLSPEVGTTNSFAWVPCLLLPLSRASTVRASEFPSLPPLHSTLYAPPPHSTAIHFFQRRKQTGENRFLSFPAPLFNLQCSILVVRHVSIVGVGELLPSTPASVLYPPMRKYATLQPSTSPAMRANNSRSFITPRNKSNKTFFLLVVFISWEYECSRAVFYVWLGLLDNHLKCVAVISRDGGRDEWYSTHAVVLLRRESLFSPPPILRVRPTDAQTSVPCVVGADAQTRTHSGGRKEMWGRGGGDWLWCAVWAWGSLSFFLHVVPS